MDGAIFSDSQQVLAYAQLRGLYNALVFQVKKDFTRVNLSLAIVGCPESKQLQALITEKIYLLLMERFPDYLNVMYAVDIPERAFKHIEMTDTVDVAEQVTFLILSRELQKVELKEKYRSKD